MMLTKQQIRKLIELTQMKEVAEFSDYKVMQFGRGGYSDDPEIGALQATLSMMLQGASD